MAKPRLIAYVSNDIRAKVAAAAKKPGVSNPKSSKRRSTLSSPTKWTISATRRSSVGSIT
ncbi:hypothetical protein [Hyphococcus sp.]|uniref:hypothetical protein n=1 Tax=Hyphococcus sp. TaxID=2038636 RepID=UPI003CCBC118